MRAGEGIILVIGAYGFIGSGIARMLIAEGHAVRGLGRSATPGQELPPEIGWIAGDLRRMTAPGAWDAALEGVGCVVNVAGVLQDGARDSVDAVHEHAVRALVAACVGREVRRFVQISATGASADAPAAFFRSKARGDAAVRESPLDWAILRPGLVIGPDAYGGTALLRGLAAVPLVEPTVLADAPVQTVALSDVARAACRAAAGGLPPGTEVDLVTPEALPLRAVVGHFRAWLGFASPRRSIALPRRLAVACARLCDALGWLGWRPPLRSTALAALAAGVRGDPEPWRALTGERLPGLAETLAAMPATAQERRFARLYFAMPLAVAALAIFATLTGAMEIGRAYAAPEDAAGPIGRALAAASLAAGFAVLVRPWARRACLALALVGLAHLGLGAGPWAGAPLATGVALLPAVLLALVTAAMLDER